MKGEALCQQRLVERYSPMLFTIARRYAGNMEDAQDILQDAFIKIFRSLPNYREKGRFEGWLRTIVITTALDHIDKSWNKNEQKVEYLPEPDDYYFPDTYATMGVEALMKLVMALPDGYRQIFNLSVIEDYSHNEIAAMLGISESTSRSQLVRARKLLQQMIQDLEKVRL